MLEQGDDSMLEQRKDSMLEQGDDSMLMKNTGFYEWLQASAPALFLLRFPGRPHLF